MDGKDLLRRVRHLLNEESDTGWLDDYTTYDFLYEAAKDLVDRTGCLRSTQSITTVADDDEYDLNPDFLRLYIKNDDNEFVIKLNDGSNDHFLKWKDFFKVFKSQLVQFSPKDEKIWDLVPSAFPLI